MLYRVEREDFRWVVWRDEEPGSWESVPERVAEFVGRDGEGMAREYVQWLNVGWGAPSVGA